MLKSLFEKYKELILYIIFGVGTTVVSFVAYYICIHFGVHYVAANVISWIFAVIFAFVTNKGLVFGDKNSNLKHIIITFLVFCMSRLASLIVETLLMVLGVEVLSVSEDIVKIPVSVIVVILNYITGKFLVFRKK